MVGEGVVGRIGEVCHIRGKSFGDRLVVGPFGERLVRGQSLGDRLVVGPFGERLPERAMGDRGDFWGSEMARPKGK
jgi:hypothetical protein